jgi:type II secretory pathway predicted ATPase ExeA
VRHRLRVAGSARSLFTDEALGRLHSASAGIPRVVNQLATQALIEAMARGASEVGDDVMAAVQASQPFPEEAA